MGFHKSLLVYQYRRGKRPVIKDGLAFLQRHELDSKLQQRNFFPPYYTGTLWTNIAKTAGFNIARSQCLKVLALLSSLAAQGQQRHPARAVEAPRPGGR